MTGNETRPESHGQTHSQGHGQGNAVGHDGGQDGRGEAPRPTQLPPLLAGRGPAQAPGDEAGGAPNGRRTPQARRLAGNLHTAPPTTSDHGATGGSGVSAGHQLTNEPGGSPAETGGGADGGWVPQGHPQHPEQLAPHQPDQRQNLDRQSGGSPDSAWAATGGFERPRARPRGLAGLGGSGADAVAASEVFSLRTYPDGSLELVDNLPVSYSVVREIRDALGDQLVGDGTMVPLEAATPLIEEQIRGWHQRWMNRGEDPLTEGERRLLRHAVENAIYRMGRIQPLLELPGLTDIIIRGPRPVRLHFVSGPVLTYAPTAENHEDLISDIKSWVAQASTDRPFDQAHPRLNIALPDGSRLSGAGWFTAWPTASIRLHPLVDIDLDDCLQLGMIDDGMCKLLRAAIRAGKTIVVSGMMKAGKTVLIRAILNELDPAVPIATIETEFELMLHELTDRHYEVWPAQELIGGEDKVGEMRVSDIMPEALRQTVDVVVVGEVRSDEVVSMLQAMQGGKSSVTTIHASSAVDTVDRIVSCATTFSSASETWAYRQVGHSVDLIVHIGVTDERALGGDRLRYVDEIFAPELGRDSMVTGDPIYVPGPDGRGIPSGHLPQWISDLDGAFDYTHYLTNRRSAWPKPLPSVRSDGQASA